MLWNSLLLSEKLYPHLREIDETANRRLEQMMPELIQSAGVTESLKASDPIGQLMEQGQFASNVEVIEAESYERTKLAEALWYHYGDISDEARAQGYMPTLSEHRHGGFPDATARASSSGNPTARM